ncbi:hypothetical protein HMPREF1982_03536 [Clostridiales bacterium oral taxon 876 str. F0540]|nr:hypothetical protein HMPREF1982_03536 [Clostridiales bacterium oral taxon 876 str. F0540]
MIKFKPSEFQYIQSELKKLLYDNDEGCVLMRKGLTKEDIVDIQHFINTVDKVNVNEDENKKFIHVIIEHLGMWCFVDAEYTYNELLQLIKDRQYCNLYNKLILDKEEE